MFRLHFCNADDIHVREVILQVVQHVLDVLGDHAHPLGIPRAVGEPHVHVPSPSHHALDPLQPCSRELMNQIVLNSTKNSCIPSFTILTYHRE